MSEKLDFSKLIQRDKEQSQRGGRAASTALYQCVVFLGKPVIEEVDELNSLKFKLLCPKVAKRISEQRFIFPYYSKEVFGLAEEAANFFPQFIKRLISEGKLPEEVILEDKSVDESLVQLGIMDLQMTFLEKDLPEFKGF